MQATKQQPPTIPHNAPTLGTLFGGFEGVGIGALMAGLRPIWSIESDPTIAEVAHANLGHDAHVADILNCDPMRFDAVDVLHASPPCTNASVANTNAGETELDKALARKVVEFVTTLQPRIFTLENVWAYRRFESWQMIEDALHKAGYWLTVDHVNCADHGVPQTRKRMIVRAVRGGFVPYLAEPLPWVGWYEAIEDMLDTLPDSQFAPWQLARLPKMMMTLLVGQGGFDGGVVTASEDAPAFTVTANHNQLGVRAFLAQVQGEGGDGVLLDTEPMQTVTANHGAAKYRAFLVGDQNRQFANEERPAFVVCAKESGGYVPRAWLVDGANAHTDGRLIIRPDDNPALTITTGGPRHQLRSLLESGRVVAMTPRALARFQSFPDWYVLPDNARLAALGIGNAVPPALYQRIIAQLMVGLL